MRLPQPENVPSVPQTLCWLLELVLLVLLAPGQLLDQLHAQNVLIPPIVFLVVVLLLALVPLAPQTITCLTVNAQLALLAGSQLLLQPNANNVVIPIVMLVLVLPLAHVPLVQQTIT